MIKKINEDLYYIGVLDSKLQVFDVIMETKFGTSYNSYLIKTTNNNILVETVKDKFFAEYLQNINELVGINNITYLIVDHTEPDHAGSIEKLLELNPNIKIIGSKAAISYLQDICNKEFHSYVVKPNEEIKIDNKTLQFISAPYLHWPDSIYTYLKEDKALFTCDSFGSHYAFADILLSNLKEENKAGYNESLKYYYDAIFSPFKKFVLQALDKIKNLDINYICTGHGPVIDQDIKKYYEIYREWSEVNKKSHYLVVIPYATSYGYTEKMANLIKEGILSVNNNFEVKMYDINILNYNNVKAKIMADIDNADAILFGSTTINKDATNIMLDLTSSLSPIVHNGKFACVFGSYGWSGEGVDNIHVRLKCACLKVLPSVKLKFKPSVKDENILIDYGKNIANSILSNENKVVLISDQKITMKE